MELRLDWRRVAATEKDKCYCGELGTVACNDKSISLLHPEQPRDAGPRGAQSRHKRTHEYPEGLKEGQDGDS